MVEGGRGEEGREGEAGGREEEKEVEEGGGEISHFFSHVHFF
jgi:hypothetical protein